MRAELLAPSPAIQIVHVDDAILVLDKPPGLLSVPGRGADKQDCLSRRVQEQFPDALVVHRLDMATSGLIVMARGTAVQRALSEAFAQRMVAKQYEAQVHGECMVPTGTWRTIELPIGVDWPNRPLRIIDHANGKASTTRLYRVHFDPERQVTHVRLEPLTGRTHQLRVHLRAIGHPILGDRLYAPAPVVAMAPELQLHASALSFSHPISGMTMHFVSHRLKCAGENQPER